MAVPTLLNTWTGSQVRDEKFAGLTYHVEGELVPVLQVELQGTGVFFEHHVLFWKDPEVTIGVKPMQGTFKRVIAGMPIFMTEASGPGRIAFSRDGVGHIFALHLGPNQAVDVREHQFLAASNNVQYSFRRVQGVANMLFSGTGFFIDTFAADRQEGVLWLHGYGNVFELELQVGEQIDVEPGGWIYKEMSVNMETKMQKLSTGLFASGGQMVWNRFTGPGHIGLQSMCQPFMPGAGA